MFFFVDDVCWFLLKGVEVVKFIGMRVFWVGSDVVKVLIFGNVDILVCIL